MAAVICTLFEGHYHHGVAALTNSLYAQGYKGDIFVGYRGELPKWSNMAEKNFTLNWNDATTLEIDNTIKLHFLPINTDYHLTNYKPDFMINLWKGPAKNCKSMFFFDSDIVVNSNWKQFLEWVECGIAVCEDINSPISEFHPKRVAWRNFYKERGISLSYKHSIYINGGFLGLNLKDYGFLILWRKLQEEMAPIIGGLNRSSLNGNNLPLEATNKFAPFSKTDQDALNATIEAWDGKISFVGKEGMGFKNRSGLMSHPLDQPKPWKRNYLIRSIKGIPPNATDKNYWKYSIGPINSYSKVGIYWKKLNIFILNFIGRFYKKI